MITQAQALKLVPKPKGINIVKYKNGITQDIIEVIISVFRNHYKQVQQFAPLFRQASLQDTLALIHDYVRQNIAYKLDKKGEQLIKRPSAIVHQAQGDCKAYSILIGSILQCLKIPFSFRFVSYKAGKDYTHIYVVVGEDKIPIDACLKSPFIENRFYKHLDIDMTQIAEIGKANCQCNNAIGCTCNPIKKYSFQVDKMENPYEAEINGIFKKKEGGTKVGNFLRKANEFSQKAAPLVSALPIPGANLAAKVLKAGSKVYNVVDKVTKMPKAVPLKEVINTVKAEFAPQQNFDPSQATPSMNVETTTTNTGNTPKTESKSNLPLLLAVGAAAFFMFGKKKR